MEARSPGVAINLRGEPGLDSRVVTTLLNGTTVTIIGGPAAVDGVNWWEVDGGAHATHGWAAESLLKPAPATAAPQAAASTECAVTGPTYPGIFHCQRPNNVHVVVIDLNDPHVRFETVMAHDVEHVGSAPQEWVQAMAERLPGAAAAINGDYFHAGRNGPEGLTIRNGTRLDGLASMERSALVIGQAPLDSAGARLPIPAAVVRLADTNRPLDPAQAHNAVGGGPQLVFEAKWRWEQGFGFPGYRGCANNLPADQVINGECLADIGDWRLPAKPWSVSGLTRDHKMVWVVGPYAHMAETLAAFGVETAMKLDSGGSSQLWYDRTMVPGYRPVANGLVVFYEHSAEVDMQSQWPVLVAGQAQRLQVTLRNTGADTWQPGEVQLVGPANQHSPSVPLPHPVRPGESVTVTWMSGPRRQCGVWRETWRLAEGERHFPGGGLSITSLVLPASMAAERSDVAEQISSAATRAAALARLESVLPALCGRGALIPGASR